MVARNSFRSDRALPVAARPACEHHPPRDRLQSRFLSRRARALHAWALSCARRLQVAGELFIAAPPEYVIVRKLEFYREGGSEKHLRDIRSMLGASAHLLDRAELGRMINERGLELAWNRVGTFRT